MRLNNALFHQAWLSMGVLGAGLVGCVTQSESTAELQQGLALGPTDTTNFLWSCPQPTDPDLMNAGDACLAAYGGNTAICSALCCPTGSRLTYDGDGGGFVASSAYCEFAPDCGGYALAHINEFPGGCETYRGPGTCSTPWWDVAVSYLVGEGPYPGPDVTQYQCCCHHATGGN